MKHSKKLAICAITLGIATSFIIANSHSHKSEISISSKTEYPHIIVQDFISLSLSKDFANTYETTNTTTTKLTKGMKKLLKCQLKEVKKLQINEDEVFNTLLEDYKTSLSKSIKNLDNFKVEKTKLHSYTDKAFYLTKIMKEFDIITIKSFNTFQDKYHSNKGHEDFSYAVKYLLQIYNQSPDTYESFIPTKESYDKIIYPS